MSGKYIISRGIYTRMHATLPLHVVHQLVSHLFEADPMVLKNHRRHM